jgi:hypothetical protein
MNVKQQAKSCEQLNETKIGKICRDLLTCSKKSEKKLVNRSQS